MEGRCKMGYRLRRILVSKYMTIFGLRACPLEKAFPGKKQWEEMKAEAKNDDKKNKEATVVPKSTGKDNWMKITDSSSQNSLVSGMVYFTIYTFSLLIAIIFAWSSFEGSQF